MKIHFLLPAICLIILMAGCAEKNTSASAPPIYGFMIVGSVKDVPDSTWLYIESADNSGSKLPIDSGLVLNERFELRGEIKESPLLSVLRTKNYSDYRFLWLEKTVISFEGERGKFREAKVNGSATEKKNNELDDVIAPLGKTKDSLRALLAGESLSASDKQRLTQEIEEQGEIERQKYFHFVRENPNSIVTAYILDVYKSAWGKEKTEELFKDFSDQNKITKYGSSISTYLSLNKNPQLGDSFADFTQRSLDGKQVSLSDYKGKVILLEFWPSWCGPCRIENPDLVETYGTYKAKGFEVLGVSLDTSEDSWKKAIEKDRLPWVHVSELKGDKNTAALIYGVSGIPDNFLIDRNGTIVGRNLRGEELNDRLGKLLK